MMNPSPLIAREAVRFLLRLKHLIRGAAAVVHLALPSPSLCPSSYPSSSMVFVSQLCQVADTVLAVQTFAGRAHSVPYEFAEFCGFLTIHKVQEVGVFASFRPPGSKFGLRRDRRKLHIEPLHLPPEQSRAFAGVGGFDLTSSASGSGAVVGSVEIHRLSSHPPPPLDASSSHLPAESPSQEDVSGRRATPLTASLAALKASRSNRDLSTSLTQGQSVSVPLPAPISISGRPAGNTTSLRERIAGKDASLLDY